MAQKTTEKTDNAVKNGTKKSRTDMIAKILCVFAAFCLWLYVMVVESPEYKETFTHITVELLNTEKLTEKELAIFSGFGSVVDVTLSGKKSVVSNIAENEIVVTADVGSISGDPGRYNCKLSVDVPAGCQLSDMSQETISVYVDRAAQKSVGLTEIRENTKLPEGCFTGAIEFPVDKITVYGPELALEKVKNALVVIDMTGIEKTSKVTEKVVLVDKNNQQIESPYLSYYPEEVTVTVPVNKTVSVPLEAVFKHGFLSEDNTEVELTPPVIEVTGDASIINRGNLIEAIEINEKEDFTGGVYSETVTVKSVGGVTLSTNQVEVTAKVDRSIKTREITIPGENIKDTGGKAGVKYTWDKSPVTVTVMGDLKSISSITAEDITLLFDMSPYSETNTGTIRIWADVVIDSPNKDEILDIGYYIVTVTFEN